jgi:cyclomaltodextrinase / maltogenic alpha-amylase / neopullulanase
MCHFQYLRSFAAALAMLLFTCSHLAAQTLPVTFRLADPQKRYTRAFVPGEFNNWGPNAGGRISTGAVSEMIYDAASGAWTKTLMLTVGQRYLYKFHVHRDALGAQYDWLPDPLNEVQDGSSNQNSVMQIVPLLIFQPALQTSNGAVSGVNASIVGAAQLTRLAVIAGRDTTTVSSAVLNAVQQSGRLQFQFPAPVPTTASVRILATGANGNTAFYRFPVVINAVPAWAKDVVWYQIFPERFRNGDPTNDPTRESLELGNGVSDKWRIKPWGSDWFSREEWEREFGANFYTNAIFHRRYGGDLQGVIDKLDYLKELGITAIYLNPIFYANSLHKYDGNTLHHIDPYFGPNPKADLEQIARENASAAPYAPATWRWTSADSLFLRLIRETKRRNMRLIIDGVFNHTGRSFFAFQDIVQNQAQSRFKDWYAVSRFDDPATPQNEFAYKAWENFTSLPEFARSPDGRDLAPAPKDYIWNITRRWMDPNGDGNPEDGIDGWRLDVVPYMPLGFWNEWNAYVRTLNPNAYTTAEIWTDATPATVRGGNFSAAMNYWAFQQPVKDFFINKRGTAQEFWNTITSRMNAYTPEVQSAMQNMMDSHDTERLASQIVNSSTGSLTSNAWSRPSYQVRKPTEEERNLQKLIALFQMTFTGAPMLYYGTESGVWGGNDPDDRSPMNWSDIRFDTQSGSPSPAFLRPVADDMNFDSSLAGFYKNLIRLAFRCNPPSYANTREGNFTIGGYYQTLRLPTPDPVLAIYQDGGAIMRYFDGVIGYHTECSRTTVINRSNDSTMVTLDRPNDWFGIGEPIFYTHGEPKSVKYSRTYAQKTLTLPPQSGVILVGFTTVSVRDKELVKIPRAYPQPFTERTTLEYTLEAASQVVVRVHDVLGHEVLRMDEGTQAQGVHTLEIDGSRLAGGVYVCTVQTGRGAVQRVMLVKQ